MSTSASASPHAERPWPRAQARPFLLGLALLSLAFCLLALGDDTVDSLVKEDGVVEWAGALGLFAGSALFATGFVRARRQRPEGMAALGVWVLLGLAIALFFLGGEEISWGQRLFGWGTPEAITSVNAQDETTLHNLNLFQGTTLDGDRLFRVGWICLFVLLPLAALLWPWLRRTFAPRVPIVPLWLAGLFLAAWVLTTLAVDVFDGAYDGIYAIGSAGTEIQEACVELLMGLAALLTLRRVRAGRYGVA